MNQAILTIVLPCYNESANLPQIVKKLSRIEDKNIEIILVDNGSTDDTPTLMKNLLEKTKRFKVIRIENNIGYGNGIMTGVWKASGNIIAWTHADLQTDPKDVISAYKIFMENDNTEKIILKGKRRDRNIFDVFFTASMSIVSSLYLGVRLSDINAQPKMFHRSFIKHLSNAPDDFSLDLFFIYKARQLGYDIIEYPVYFHKRTGGESKGGGTIKGKVKLIIRTWKYIIDIKRKI